MPGPTGLERAIHILAMTSFTQRMVDIIDGRQAIHA
ncbi:hypothetical protein Fraau_3133 [Frateuria aurantia DSM 6220]|uniref:Uncharacterized protein n=1 Tax=Frateuria aurantia (strain ATCC 33424 / DSM 6220 / KCTC 2777 / LMG 1558 / NBRC 3245 / NCIMB 13370) TaxID=767434 RepID=H8L0G3_FRAAD|nr:hypothetical protein Fraau_3130 [Frateuria aurantia DSM 6220]AFC87458.1 hypothetical protein Fraau_3133 [Frateuria aurantia DSM 6220]